MASTGLLLMLYLLSGCRGVMSPRESSSVTELDRSRIGKWTAKAERSHLSAALLTGLITDAQSLEECQPGRLWSAPCLGALLTTEDFGRMGLDAARSLLWLSAEENQSTQVTVRLSVERWLTQAAGMPGYVGSPDLLDSTGNADADFALMSALALLYGFETHPAQLSDEAAYQLLSLCATDESPPAARQDCKPGVDVPLLGTNATHLQKRYGGAVRLMRYPETENHVLMINTWRYLAAQWVALNPRDDARLESLQAQALPTATSTLAPFLLSALGRVLHNGFFETNARPYQGFTLRALWLLSSYSRDEYWFGKQIKTAARNALDYLAVKITFQSWQGRRYGLQRRNFSYRKQMGLSESDYPPTFYKHLSLRQEPSPSQSYDYRSRDHLLRALDAEVGSYRLPDVIADFFRQPDNHRPGYGSWARMQARFTERHYRGGYTPAYLAPNFRRQPNLNADINAGRRKIIPAPEFYFRTADYLHSSGGTYRKYTQGLLASLFSPGVLNLYSKPSIQLWHSSKEFTDLPGAESDNLVLAPAGTDTVYRRDGLGVFLNVMTGIHHQRVIAPAPCQRSGELGRWSYCSFERPGADPHRRMVTLLAQRQLRPGGRKARRLGRRRWEVIWEVVPLHHSDTIARLTARWLSMNEEGLVLAKPRYRSVLNGNAFIIDTFASKRPLKDVRGGSLLRTYYMAPHPPEMPLLEVWQTNEHAQPTGLRYALAKDGVLQVCNPHLDQSLTLNASDHHAPSRSLSKGCPAPLRTPGSEPKLQPRAASKRRRP